MNKTSSMMILIFLFFVTINNAYAYKTDTHSEINKTASESAKFVDALSNKYLTLTSGIDTVINNKKVWLWIFEGGKYEDEPIWRAFRHFHDPLKPWDDAGLKSIWDSSVLRAQRINNEWSWPKARDYFYSALTELTHQAREENLAKTFRSVGQVMHLIQDASVPPHVRDDIHIIDGTLLPNYENIVKGFNNPKKPSLYKPIIFQNAAATPIRPDTSILNIAPNNLAPVPIARLVDTDYYDGTNPNITASSNIGIAEYTNANFFSNDTVRSRDYPHPDINNCSTIVERLPYEGAAYNRPYWMKTAGQQGAECGEDNNGQGYLLAAVDTLNYYREQYPDLVGIIDNIEIPDTLVFEDYAKLLLPRAIGYSAALLDYFFRGKIDLIIPDNGLEVVDPFSVGFDRITLNVSNNSDFGDDLPNGSVDLVVTYKPAMEDYYPGPYDDEYRYIRVELPNDNQAIPRAQQNGDPGTTFTFDLSGNPLPFGAREASLMLVYKGDIGKDVPDGAGGTVFAGEKGNGIAVGNKPLDTILMPDSLEISLPDDGYYARKDNYPLEIDNLQTSKFDNVSIKLKKLDPTIQDEGELILVVKYLKTDGLSGPFGDAYAYFNARTTHNFIYSTASKTNVILPGPTDPPEPFDFNFPDEPTQIPLWSSDVYLYIVYIEPGGGRTFVGFKDISEPTPVDLINTGDKVCIDGLFYIAGSPEAFDALANFPDADPWDDVYPHNMENVYIKLTSYNADQSASDQNKDFHLQSSLANENIRLAYILTDRWFSYSRSSYLFDPIDLNDQHSHDYWGQITLAQRSARNQIELFTDPQDCPPNEDTCHWWLWDYYKKILNTETEVISPMWIVNPEIVSPSSDPCPYSVFFE